MSRYIKANTVKQIIDKLERGGDIDTAELFRELEKVKERRDTVNNAHEHITRISNYILSRSKNVTLQAYSTEQEQYDKIINFQKGRAQIDPRAFVPTLKELTRILAISKNTTTRWSNLRVIEKHSYLLVDENKNEKLLIGYDLNEIKENLKKFR